jgi:hypothetical protein
MEKLQLPPNRFNINLPPLTQVNYSEIDKAFPRPRVANTNKIHINPTANEKSNIPEPLDSDSENIRSMLQEKLQKEHFKWNVHVPFSRIHQVHQNKDVYRFDLPASQFENEMDIQKVELPEYTFTSKREKLNEQQLKEIWEDGQFKVKSEMKNLPHVWRIAPWLVSSSKKKLKWLQNVLALCWAALFAVVNIFDPNSSRISRLRLNKAILRANFFNIFVSVYACVLNVLDLVLGIRFRVIPNQYINDIKKHLAKKEFIKLTKKEEELTDTCRLIEFARYPQRSQFDMADPVQNKKFNEKNTRVRKFHNQLQRASNMFRKEFDTKLKEELIKEDFEEEEMEAIKENFNSNKQNMLFEFLEKKKGEFEDPEIVDLLIKKMKMFVLIQDLEEQQQKERKALKKKEEEKFVKARPI